MSVGNWLGYCTYWSYVCAQLLQEGFYRLNYISSDIISLRCSIIYDQRFKDLEMGRKIGFIDNTSLPSSQCPSDDYLAG